MYLHEEPLLDSLEFGDLLPLYPNNKVFKEYIIPSSVLYFVLSR